MNSRHRMSADDLSIGGTRRVDEDVRGELEFHISERAAELEASGMPRDKALAEARELFGDRSTIEAECREIEQRRRHTRDRAFRFRSLVQDVTIGLRILRKSPTFTFASIITLALGIGANAAVFSIINQVILKPLPYPDADRIATVYERHEKGWGSVPWATYLDLHQQSRSFDALAEHTVGAWTVLTGGRATRVPAAGVTADFFRVFGVKAARGRLPLPDEHRLGATPVAVVSHAFWRDQLGAPASLENVHFKADRDYNVVGVMPVGFEFPSGAQIWVPLELQEQTMSYTAHNWDAIAKLRAGVSPASAERELGTILTQLKALHQPDFDATGAVIKPLQFAMTENLRTPLYLLLAASTVLLLAACTNLASAQLARGTARAGEMAVRAALGASRTRLVRQLLTESMLLAVLGAMAGLLLAQLMLKGFALVAIPAMHLEDVRVDWMVQAFALLAAVLTAVLFGLYPAFRISETNTATALREGGRGTPSKRSTRVWHLLVAAEVALAVTLLSASTVLIRSFAEIMRVDLGFDPTNVTTARVNLPEINYNEKARSTAQFHDAALARLAAVPGVEAAGFSNRLPLEGANPSGGTEIEGKAAGKRGPTNGYAIYRVVGGDYFKALGIRLIEGRAFGPGDDATSAPVVIVNQEFAQREWPGKSALGQRVRPSGMDRETEPWYTVIGVVASERAGALTDPFQETYYFDHRQRPSHRSMSTSYAVRSHLDNAVVTSILRREIAAVDPQVPIAEGTMAKIMMRSVADRRFTMLLLSAFSAVALALALVGIYSVVSYTVARRTRELGVRLALGASARDLRRLVLISAMSGVVPGLVLGTLMSLASSRSLEGMLYGIQPADPGSLAIAVGVLGLVGLLSTVLPARRATRVDPMVAMRAE